MNNILQERDELIYHLRAKIKELEGELQRTRSSEILSLPVEGFDCTLGELPEQARKMREVITDIIDDQPCSFDHHGYCQTHGWMSSSLCPHKRGRETLTFKDKP